MPNILYAQVDQNGKVLGVSELAAEIKSEQMIPITQEMYDNLNILHTSFKDGDFVGYYAVLETDKESIPATGTDTLKITAKVYDWRNVPQPDFAQELLVEVNGIRQSVKLNNGVAEMTLSSEEPGEFTVRTVNMDRNGETQVVITDEA